MARGGARGGAQRLCTLLVRQLTTGAPAAHPGAFTQTSALTSKGHNKTRCLLQVSETVRSFSEASSDPRHVNLAVSGGELQARGLRSKSSSRGFGGSSGGVPGPSNPGNAAAPLRLPLDSFQFMIWGANTGVGKTLVSAGLVATLLKDKTLQHCHVSYIKPVQTGYPTDSDSRLVGLAAAQPLSSLRNLSATQPLDPLNFHLAWGITQSPSDVTTNQGTQEQGVTGSPTENSTRTQEQGVKGSQTENSTRTQEQGVTASQTENSTRTLLCKTLRAWGPPVSPHLAAGPGTGTLPEHRSDAVLMSELVAEVTASPPGAPQANQPCDAEGSGPGAPQAGREREVQGKRAAERQRYTGGRPGREEWTIVETAGGVGSPGPSGTLQCDLYRPLRLPAVLVADSALGGISATVAAKGVLEMRGHDVAAVVVGANSQLQNDEFLRQHFEEQRIPVITLPALPPAPGPSEADPPQAPLLAWQEPGEGRVWGTHLARNSANSTRSTNSNSSNDSIDSSTSTGVESAEGSLRRVKEYPLDSSLVQWLEQSAPAFQSLVGVLRGFHNKRVQDLISTREQAGKILWWPFTQHGLVAHRPPTVIDSRSGEYLSVFHEASDRSKDASGIPSGAHTSTEARPPGGLSLQQSFDACASWWTQGPDVPLQMKLAQSIGHAAGRYGHVMFPENAHSPAVDLASLLLAGPGKGWADRVYYSDNGSTAIEVGIKMGLRAFTHSYRHLLTDLSSSDALDLKVVALSGSYHGDTLGAMEAQSPSPFTGAKQQPWYRGQGIFLDPPTVALWNSADSASSSSRLPPWKVHLPPSWGTAGPELQREMEFADREGVFAVDTRLSPPGSPLVHRYWDYISESLAAHLVQPCRSASEVDLVNASSPVDLVNRGQPQSEASFEPAPEVDLVNAEKLVDPVDAVNPGGMVNPSQGIRSRVSLGKQQAQGTTRSASTLASARSGEALASALIIEPVLHGAGGMELVDPLFQRVLVAFCRAHGIPVIFDEVFAGCWRLGRESAAELLGCCPDIACYSKLLTGGTIPLAATLATEAVFEAFLSESKLDALLHGHSYTAHAIGCSAAVTALKSYKDPKQNGNYLESQNRLKELWDLRLIAAIATLPAVLRVVHMGTVFALELRTPSEKGGSKYASTATSDIVQELRSQGVFVRPLGNVLYLMCTPFTTMETCSALLSALRNVLQQL